MTELFARPSYDVAKIELSPGTFPTKLHVHLAKIQISLRVRTVLSESSEGTLWQTSKTLIRLRWAYMQPYKKCCTQAQFLRHFK